MAVMPKGAIIDATPEQLAAVKYDASGLVAAIAQDIDTKAVLMMAWMNADTLQMTLAEGRVLESQPP
jgi:phosphoribosyl-AMP cyclohydrolase